MLSRAHIPVIATMLAVLIFGLCGACSDNAVGPEALIPDEWIHISGAVNEVFDKLFISSVLYPSEGREMLELKFIGSKRIREQTATINIYMLLSSPQGEDVWEAGEYTFEKGDVPDPGKFKGEATYRINCDTHEHEYDLFDLTSLSLKIERFDSSRFVGKFSVIGQYEYGQRTEHGQEKDVTLGEDGQINIIGPVDAVPMLGSFDLATGS